MNNKFPRNKIAKALMLASGMGVVPLISYAAVIGSQTGNEIILTDGTTLIADQSSGDGYYGILVNGATAATVTIGSGSTVRVSDAERYAKGIFIEAANSEFTADKLTLNVSGKTAVGIEFGGKNVTASLGSGSSVTTVASGDSFAEGVVVSNSSSLQANNLQISTQGTGGTALRVSGYGSHASLGDDSNLQTNGLNSNAVQVDNLTGESINGVATLKANALTINTLGNNSQGINIQDNGSVDLGSNSTIITTGDLSAGIWSWGELKADHLTISTAGETSAGLSGRDNSLSNIGAGSVISSDQTGGIVAMGDNAIVNLIGSEEERNTVYSAGFYGVSAQSTGATINLQNTDIMMKNVDTMTLGIWSTSGGTVNGDAVTITGPENATGVYAMAGGKANLTGDLTIDMSSPDGITARKEGRIDFNLLAIGQLMDLHLLAHFVTRCIKVLRVDAAGTCTRCRICCRHKERNETAIRTAHDFRQMLIACCCRVDQELAGQRRTVCRIDAAPDAVTVLIRSAGIVRVPGHHVVAVIQRAYCR